MFANIPIQGSQGSLLFVTYIIIQLLKRLHIVLIKTFTMHVEDVSMEIACKSAVYEYVYQILLHY